MGDATPVGSSRRNNGGNQFGAGAGRDGDSGLTGGLLQIDSDDSVVKTLAFLAIVVATVNIFGGFAVTGRMLQMFRKD